MSPDEREFALAKYNADRAHELALDLAGAPYEVAFFQGLFALNGGSAAVFVALMASNLTAVLRSGPIVWGALAFWLTGLVVAYEAARRAYEAQKTYASAKRSARHAMGLHAFGRYDRHILQISSRETPDDLLAEATRRQIKGDAEWTRAHRIGLPSAACFIAGVLLAAGAVARGQETASQARPPVATAVSAPKPAGETGESRKPHR